ncbi:MAG: L-threonylcarbamoyladenylate synthase [Candidatus Nealsonbacteria bacterium]
MNSIELKNVKIKELADTLREGLVIVCPTDTVYGMICDVRNKKSVNKLFKIKERDKQKFIPFFVKDIKMAKSLAKINKEQNAFLKKVWPGKITVILEKKKGKKLYGVDNKKIALRVSDHKLIKALFRNINFPLSGTSANVSNKKSAINVKEVLDQFKGKKILPDLIIDGGRLDNRKSSTIFDLTVKPFKILRQ